MELINQTQTLVAKIRESYNPAVYSFEIVIDTDSDDRYLLALEYLNNATMNLLAAENYYETHRDLERHDFDSYFEAFSEYKFQLLKVVKENDRNKSWLSSKKDSLETAKRNVEKFLEIMNDNHEIVQRRREDNKIKPEDIQGFIKAPKYD